MRHLSLQMKLLGALLGVGLLTLLVTAWQADTRADAALRQAVTDHLTSIREERRIEIEAYFARVQRDALRLAESRTLRDAMPELKAAYRAFEREVSRWPEDERTRARSAVEHYYRSSFAPRLRALGSPAGPTDVTAYLPTEDATIALQAQFIVLNPHAEDARDRLDRPAGGGRYADVHARLNPYIRSVIRDGRYADLFLIDHETGRIVYTVAKELEFATSLLSGPYRDTRLSRAFRNARVAIDADFVRLVDFESYAPSLGAPAAFVAAPIFEEGRRVGVVALQIPLERINAVMTGDRKWPERGLGETGETYLIGPDRRMRSDSRLMLESPDRFLEIATANGTPPEILALMRTHRSTVLFQQITSPGGRAAVSGRTGTLTMTDYRGRPALASYAPLAVPDLRWGIVAKRDTAEAFAPARALRRALMATGAVAACVVVAMAVLLARSLTRPIHRLIAGMRILGHGDLTHRLAEARRDEIGQIATAFDRMAEELQQTTVSRDHVNSILDSTSDALFVVRPPDGKSDWREAVIVTVNPAACSMLGQPADAVLGQPVADVISSITAPDGGGDGDPGVWLEEVLRQERIGAREVVCKLRDGREMPVLFSGAVMRRGTSDIGGIVCAAHDLTELKATEAHGAFIRDTFGRYVSAEVVANLLSSPAALTLGGELRKVTVLMSDLRGFTVLAERLSPEGVIAFLNVYLQTMVDLILQYRGTINEIMGDGIVVIFGAPAVANDDAERAVACALAMQLAMDAVNARNRERGLPEVEMGIGIHTGEVVVGNIGSERRMKYTAIGTPVNLTARIEASTTGGQILISGATREEVGSAVTVGKQLQIEAKGVRQPLTVWEVTGIGGVHELFLDQQAARMVSLAEPLSIRYAVVDGKHVGREVFAGNVIRLSEIGAEVETRTQMPPLSNLKIWISGFDIGADTGELYAKVVDDSAESGDGMVVRFTAVDPEVRTYLRSRPLRAA